MKNKLKTLATVLAIVVSFVSQNAFSQDPFIEEGSLVVVEIESATQTSEWGKANTTASGKSITYFASKITDYSNPGRGTLSYKIKINNPGTYRFQWHCKVGEGSSPTDANDSWLKIPDADDFYAKKLSSGQSGGHTIGHIVHPKGVCTNDCPEGAGKNGWFKVYSNGTINWTWRTSTNDNDPHAIFARFDKSGTYTVQISARSAHHFINRFVLYNPDKQTESYATNLDRSQSSVSTASNLVDFSNNNLKVFPNPVSKYIEVKGSNGNEFSYELTSLSGKIMLKGKAKNKIDVSNLEDGIYFIKMYDAFDNYSVQKIIKQSKL